MTPDVEEVRPVRALTLWQPWADAVAYLGKDVENRSWVSPYTGLLLIHAGLQIDPQARKEVPKGLPDARGAVIAVARLTGSHQCEGACSEWAEPGSWHWELTDVHALTTPVRCQGMRKLWTPDGAVRSRVAAVLPTEAAALYVEVIR